MKLGFIVHRMKRERKKAKLKQTPSTMHHDHVGMKRYACQSNLIVTCVKGESPSTQIMSIWIQHHHPYRDVTMPPEVADITHENLEWTTPVSIIPKVQAAYPQVTGKQVHHAWTEMSEVLWK